MKTTYSRREVLQIGTTTLGSALLEAQAPERLNVGVIGNGKRSAFHFAALKQLQQQSQVVALCDIQSDRMQKINTGLPEKAEMYTDYRELIKDKRVGVVTIATPGYLHHEMVLAALRAGKDVLVEKPLAFNYKDALEIIRESQRTGRIVSVGFQKTYSWHEKWVRQAVESGAIGQVRFIDYYENRGDWSPISWKYTDPATGKSMSWRNLKKTCGSSELEYSVHAFSFICDIVKSPLARLSATGGVLHYKDGRDTRDYSALVADFENGIRLNYTFSCFAPAARSGWVIAGDDGVLSPDKVKPAAGKEDPDEVQMYREFFQDIRPRKQPPLSPKNVLEPFKIAYAVEMAIAEDRIVTAKDFA